MWVESGHLNSSLRSASVKLWDFAGFSGSPSMEWKLLPVSPTSQEYFEHHKN